MRENRYVAMICFALALAIRVHQHMNGTAEYVNLLLEPLVVFWLAFLLPAIIPVIACQALVFNYDSWADGHGATTTFIMAIVASAFWFFPTARIQRWFGTFDAFKEHRFRLPSLWRGAAAVLDTVNRLRAGKGKMGGWA